MVAVITEPKLSEAEKQRRKIAEKGKHDLYFFCKYIVKNPALYEPFHKPLCRWLDTWTPAPTVYCGGAQLKLTGKKHKLMLAPRGHIKSNIATVAKTVQEICKNPNIRIFIGSHKWNDAVKFSRLIRRILESDNFQYYYPNITAKQGKYMKKPSVWRDDQLLVDRSMDLVESTVECSSSDAMVIGRHYDLFMLDDLVTPKSVTPSGLRETKEFHEFSEGLADPGAREIICGTRYDFSDRYGDILDTPMLRDQYDVCNLTCFVETNQQPDEEHDLEWLCTNGTPVFPSRFVAGDGGSDDDDAHTVKSLLKILHKSGPRFFNTQYMNRPQDPTKQVFTEELLQTMYVDELPKDGSLNYFRVCDLSGENETKESFTAIVTGCVSHDSVIYITDIIRGNYTASWIMEELYRGQEVPEQVRPKLVGFEPSMFEKVMKHFLQRNARARGTYVPTKMLPIGVSRKSKPERIFGLHPFITNGMFKVLKSCKNKHLLHQELFRHPATNAVDVADACAQIPIFMFPGKQAEQAAALQKRVLPDSITKGITDDFIGNDRIITNRHPSIALGLGW